MFITQKQYDTWIKNMSKNKSGTSWVYINKKPWKCEYPNTRCKLFKDDENNLYWIRGVALAPSGVWHVERMYLKIKEEEPLCQKCKKCDCGPGAWGGLCVYSTHEEIKKWEDEH
jgi:hypothetical protein